MAAFLPQACLARQNGQQRAKRVGGAAVAFLPQACLARQSGQQRAQRVGGAAVAFQPLFIGELNQRRQ